MKKLAFQNEKVAVTGGTGFIGTPLVNALRNAGAKVRVVASLENSRKIADEFEGCKYVFHLAAIFSPSGRGINDENLIMTRNVLEASVKSGAWRMVLASSAAVYPGSPSVIPIPESSGREERPNGAYGYSKRLCENLVFDYVQKYGLQASIARIFNAYGPGDNSKRAIPNMIRDSFLHSVIYVDGFASQQTRDFIYIDDCVEGIIQCMEKGGGGDIFNICTERESSLKEVARIIAEQTGCGLATKKRARRGRRIRSVGDAALARKRLGFAARTSLEAGIAETASWMRKLTANQF